MITKDWGKWSNWRSSFLSNVDDCTLRPCAVCGRPVDGGRIALVDLRCDPCWEVEHRLAAYLNDGGKKARDFVDEALHRAIVDAP